MPGSKIPVLEIERLDLKGNGRGILLNNDDLNLSYDTSDFLTVFPSGVGSSNPAVGCIRINLLSGSTYGPTGMTLYAPLYAAKA